MTPHDRIPYSARPDRAPLRLPGDARMVVWSIVNVERWDIERPMPRTILPPPMGQPLVPDIPNWAWHEYGMRNGFWRLADLFAGVDVCPTLAINGSVCSAYPRIAEAALKAGWEFMGHGFEQRPMHHVDDQRAAIAATIDAIRQFTGKQPRGWESPGLTETADTLDLLAEAGIEYVADWVVDDEPCDIATRSGPIVSLPYTVELNDVAVIAVQRHESDAFLRRGIRQFDRLYAESARGARFMAISLHPYLSGVPHRIADMEQLYEHIRARPDVLFWTGEQILDWWLDARADVPGGPEK